MLARNLVEYKVSEAGVILVTGYHDIRLLPMGCSYPFSGQGQSVNSFSIQPKKGSAGLLALRAFQTLGSGKNERMRTYGFLLSVRWEEELPTINLEEAFIPEPGKLVQVTSSELMIEADGDFFSTAPHYDHLCHRNNNHHHEVDGSLICKYAIGEITTDEFREQVASWCEQMSLEHQILKLREEKDRLEKTANNFAELIAEWDEERRKASAQERANDTIARLVRELEARCYHIRRTPSRFFRNHNRRQRFAEQLEDFFKSIETIRETARVESLRRTATQVIGDLNGPQATSEPLPHGDFEPEA